MPMLFIESKRAEQFEKRVRPVFESRGISIDDEESFSAICRCFNSRIQVWEVWLEVPVVGSVHRVFDQCHRPAYIHDSQAHWDSQEWSSEGEVVLKVESVFGRNASCKRLPDDSDEKHSEASELSCLAFSGDLVTILAVHLESLDCFLAMDVWPNEQVPLSVAAQRVGEQVLVQPQRDEFVNLSSEGNRFVTDCVVCNGDGSVTCYKCKGSGEYLPRKQCPKCGGSGGFVGKYGDVMGSCRACNGDGYWEAKPCRACGGNGVLECYKCLGDSVQWVRFDRESEQFTTRSQNDQGNSTEINVVPTAIQLQDVQAETLRDIAGGAGSLIEIVRDAAKSRYALTPSESREIRATQQMIGDVSHCLKKALEAEAPDPYRGAPIQLSLAGATTKRKRKKAIYGFRVLGKNGPWQKAGESPFAESTPLRIIGSDGKTPLDISLQVEKGISDKSSAIMLIAVSGKGRDMRFTIQFPIEVDAGDFPDTISVLPDLIPPGEKQQIAHVKRFSRPRNHNHAVLPAMVVKEGIEFEEGLIYFDRDIGSNRRQAEAVQMGLSDIGLSLLKGPPGTGKTTVITEIVRQRIKLGQRVLVTSKNHQAVVNVLEKLDEVGGIRMARHGSSKDPSETERRYFSGGLRTRVHEEVYTKSQVTFDELNNRLGTIELHLPKVAVALRAASDLSEHRAEGCRKVRESEQNRDLGVEKAKSTYSRVEERTRQEIESANADFDQAKQLADANFSKWNQELDRRSRRRDSLQQSLSKRSDCESAKKPSWWRSVADRVAPDMLTSTAALKTRFDKTVLRIGQLEQSIAHERESVQQFTEHRDTQINTAERELKQAKKLFVETTDALNGVCNAEIANYHLRLHEQESKLLPPQRDAVGAAEFFGGKCSGDESEEYWIQIGERLAADRTETTKKIHFVDRWIRDLEADSSSVGQCHWDNLQVFFSTCVGIASWKEMVRDAERFDFAIVDEAATVTTGETIMPLMYANAGMLVGDEMQLPPHDEFEGKLCSDTCRPMPTLNGRMGSESDGAIQSTCWLSTSFFEWLWRYRPRMNRVMLNKQFRMNPRIASFVADMFYPEGLESGVTEDDRTLRFAEFTEPLCLVSTTAYGDRHEESRRSSYYNELEARMIRRIILKAEQQLNRPAHFGIITPYAEQVRQLQSEFKGGMQSFKKVRLSDDDIASVNSFQGSQRDIIIVSFVRSPQVCPRCNGSGRHAKQNCTFHPDTYHAGFDIKAARGGCRGRGWLGSALTFVQDLQRLNVALSRAKSMVILVGDIEALTNEKFSSPSSRGRGVIQAFEKYVSNAGLVLRVWETEGEL